MSGTEETPQEAMERFVIENDDLLRLEEAIGRFNIFDALGVARAEIRHSNFLAWLLDPGESHGHGDLFLKAVVMDMLRQTEPALRPLSPLALDGVEMSGVVVKREWPAKTDLCISCATPPFVLAVENKVDSGEHSNQLAKYSKAIAAQFPGIGALKIFLTRTGAVPSDDTWTVYTHADLHRVLSRVRRMAGGTLGGDVGVFLDHYLNLIGSQFMDNPEIVELCRRIYTNHRRAIDLINTHAPVSGSEALGPIVEWLRSKGDQWVIRSQNRVYMIFIPKAWVGRISAADGAALPSASCDMYLECQSWGEEETRVAARLVVGPAMDQKQRRTVIERLMAAPHNLAMARKEPSEKYTRLASKTLTKWPADAELPTEKLVSEFAGWLLALNTVIAVVPEMCSKK